MTHPISSDSRYTVSSEFTGPISGKPQHVARFCGEYIGSRPSYPAAVMLATLHRLQRAGAEPIVGVPARQ